jgi:hypothetical protein
MVTWYNVHAAHVLRHYVTLVYNMTHIIACSDTDLCCTVNDHSAMSATSSSSSCSSSFISSTGCFSAVAVSSIELVMVVYYCAYMHPLHGVIDTLCTTYWRQLTTNTTSTAATVIS